MMGSLVTPSKLCLISLRSDGLYICEISSLPVVCFWEKLTIS